MNGGYGDDLYIVDDLGDRVAEFYAAGGTDKVESAVNFTLASNVEHLTLTGTAAANGTGNGGANTLLGNGAANILDGRGGPDSMNGGYGNDIYHVDESGDRVTEFYAAGGIDKVNSAVTYRLGSNLEHLTLIGTAPIDAFGNGLANILLGNNAANTLDGGANADSMNGGGGDDLYIVDDLGDRVTEFYAAGGIDKVSSTVTFTLGSNLEHLTLTGTARANGTGNSVSNTLLGNGAANRLDGAGGADSMNGGYGDDLYLVNDAGDRVTEFYAAGGTDRVESAVSFTLGSNLEHLALTGGAAAGTGNALANEIAGNGLSNRLSGLGGNDMLDGGAGADKLFGGAGGDSLKGGLGVDGFYFDTAPDAAANVDKILDFSVADDTIFLDKSVFNGLAAPGALAGGAFVNGAAAGDADDRILYDKAAGKIFYDGDGSGAAASVLFAQVTAGTALTHLDFSAYLPPA